MLKVLVYKNGFIKKNIVSFLFIAVLANVFLGCQKDETYVDEVRIVGTSISEITATSAVFTVMLEGSHWWLDDVGIYLTYYLIGEDNYISISWVEGEGYEYINDAYVKEYIAYIEGLKPGSHYAAQAIIHKDDIFVYSDSLDFTTERN